MNPFKIRKVLVTGSRKLADKMLVWDELDTFRGTDPEILVIHGGATGADAFAGRWARSMAQPCAVFPANWDEHGKQAGPRRNRQMLHTMEPDFVLAFPLPYSIGTWDMVRVAEDAGVMMKVVRSGD